MNKALIGFFVAGVTIVAIGGYMMSRSSTPSPVPSVTPQSAVAQTNIAKEPSLTKNNLLVSSATPDTERIGELTVAPSGANRVMTNYKGDPLPSDMVVVAFDGSVHGSHVHVQVNATSDGTVTSVEYTRPGQVVAVRDASRSVCDKNECANTTLDIRTNTIRFNGQKLHQGGIVAGSANDKVRAVLSGFVEYNTEPPK